MRIKRLKASFGRLEGAELELQPGLNVIHAPNESGKSTWCAFIRAMLYGVDSAQREKNGQKPDKIKYAPWSGASMSGVMEIEHGGREIVITRETRSAASPMKSFSAVYADTGDSVPGMTGQNAGELLTGVPKAVFERTAFIHQSAIAVTGAPELEKRLSAMVSSGEEAVSFTEADSRLRAWQRARRYNRSGAMPELEKEISELGSRIAEQKHWSARIDEADSELAEAEKACALTAARVQETRREARSRALQEMHAARERLDRVSAEMQRTAEEEDERRAELEGSVFGAVSDTEAGTRAQEDVQRVRKCIEIENAAVPPTFWIIPAAAALVLALAGLLWRGGAAVLLTAAAIAAVLAIIGGAVYFRRKSAAGAASAERGRILAGYSAQTEEDIIQAAKAHSVLWTRWSNAEKEANAARIELERERNEHKRNEGAILSLLDFSGPESEGGSRELAAAEQRADRLRHEKAMAEGRVEALGDPMVMETELRALRERYAELAEQYDALELAIATLREADETMRSRFSPKLSRRAEEIFAELTNGKYESLMLQRDMTARTTAAGDVLPHEADFLSRGAEDQLYLALRLAMCELVLPGDEPCPIVLDDALVNFDSEREQAAMSLLEKLAGQRQVILFTCR